MELQWPLILFTTFISWCAGTFSSQAYLALRDKGEKVQLSAWIVSAVLLVIGGVAVFMHLEHWERIFNGFGHMSSGITQELIAIVVLVVVAIIYFAQIRRNDGKVAKWLAVIAILVSLALVVVMGHSYIMEARPAWDSFLWVLTLIGAAFILGPATVAFLADVKGDKEAAAELGLPAIIGAVINAAAALAAGFSIQAAAKSLTDVGWYYDLTHPTHKLITPELNAFTGDSAVAMILGVIIIGCVVPLVAAILGKKTGNWKVWGCVAVIGAVIGAI